MILEEIKEDYIKELLKQKKRIDGRALDAYREIKITKDFIQNAEGSAIAEVGGTKVLAGVKFDIMTPFADRPDEGVVMFGSEFSPIAHPDFNAGPPDENSIELARVVDRGIRSAESIDVKSLFLEEGKVLGVFVDLYILDHSGNLIDTAGLAAMSALKNTKIPKVEDGKIIRNEFTGKLKLVREVAVTTFEKIDGVIIADANSEEEVASEGRMSLSTSSDGFVCSAQKSGKAGFSKQELMDLIDLSSEKSKELLRHI
ncbi:exosome complex protein Rrp42 [Candidatus Micrarchaeota archaeon]|nr:exosome complex protein Rrp42 [Candidatus Micrarchaeota archaeon]